MASQPSAHAWNWLGSWFAMKQREQVNHSCFVGWNRSLHFKHLRFDVGLKLASALAWFLAMREQDRHRSEKFQASLVLSRTVRSFLHVGQVTLHFVMDFLLTIFHSGPGLSFCRLHPPGLWTFCQIAIEHLPSLRQGGFSLLFRAFQPCCDEQSIGFAVVFLEVELHLGV